MDFEFQHDSGVTAAGVLTHRPDLELEWPEALLVKQLKALRAGVHIDTGSANIDAWRQGWPRLLACDASNNPTDSLELLALTQGKYNHLGATEAAVRMLGSSFPSVRLEAICLLNALLEVRCFCHNDLCLYPVVTCMFFASPPGTCKVKETRTHRDECGGQLTCQPYVACMRESSERCTQCWREAPTRQTTCITR